MSAGVALVWLADDAPLRLRVRGRSPLSLILAALRGAALDVDVEAVGEDRAASLAAALARSPDAPLIVVWDAAWPLAGAACVTRLLAALDEHPAAVVAAPVKATIKRSRGDVISGGVPRERLIAPGGVLALRREAAEELVARGAVGAVDTGLDVAPVLDEVAAMPVRDEEGTRLAERVLP